MDTFKKTVIGFVVVLTMLVSANSADAQSLWRYLGVCPPEDELCRVMVGNQQMVRHMRSGYMGYMGSGGAFYGTHDTNGWALPRLVKIAVGAGIGASLGGGVGDLFGHGREGTLIGAGIGALIGARQGSGNRNQLMVVDEGQQIRVASDGTPIALPDNQRGALWRPGAPFAGRSNCLEQGLVTLQNVTGEALKVFVEGNYEKPVEVLMPRESRCADPDLRYMAQVLQTAVSADGWAGSTQHMPRRPEARPGLVLVWR